MFSKPGAVTQFENEIVGRSPAFQYVLNQIRIIAKTDSVTLIQGETGTGKEVIARAIHNQSSRSQGPFVKLNCAAIPGPLLESELFGHERGAFTGAFAQTKGRFQQADQGTLFLDEIGDLPLELQPKLLRALQEQEFERLGSGQTIRVNVRVVAATNQDLAQLVANKQFRADLYYRLNVIPISLPPLRERVEDIPLLVEYFVRKFSARLDKPIDVIPDEVMEVLKVARLAGKHSRTAEFHRARGGTFARIGAAACADGIEADDEAAVGGGCAHAGRGRAGTHSGCTEANRWADRRTCRRCRAAGVAAHDAGLQDAKTGNRSAPRAAGSGPPSTTLRCSPAPHRAALGSAGSNLSRPSERVRYRLGVQMVRFLKTIRDFWLEDIYSSLGQWGARQCGGVCLRRPKWHLRGCTSEAKGGVEFPPLEAVQGPDVRQSPSSWRRFGTLPLWPNMCIQADG